MTASESFIKVRIVTPKTIKSPNLSDVALGAIGAKRVNCYDVRTDRRTKQYVEVTSHIKKSFSKKILPVDMHSFYLKSQGLF